MNGQSPLFVTYVSTNMTRYVGEAFIGNLVLANATMKVILDSQTNKYRLIVLRGDRTALACFECKSPDQAMV